MRDLGSQKNPSPDPAALRGPVAGVVDRQVMEERIVAQIEALGTLPDVAAEILRLADDPDTTAAQLESVVARDPVIAGRLFKLANSTFFARSGTATTLPQAIRQLGFATIKNLVLAASAGAVLGKRLSAYDYLQAGLWDHSIGVALTCRSIARGLDFDPSVGDEVFLSGLLHDIGKLVLDPFLRDAYDGRMRLTTEHERAVVVVDHTEIGARVARKWKLPDHATEVISAHHDPAQAPRYARHASVVSLCDYFVTRERIGRRPDTSEDPVVPAATLERLSLDETDVGELGARLRDDLEAMSAFQGLAA